jgi:hypothetical protein
VEIQGRRNNSGRNSAEPTNSAGLTMQELEGVALGHNNAQGTDQEVPPQDGIQHNDIVPDPEEKEDEESLEYLH